MRNRKQKESRQKSSLTIISKTKVFLMFLLFTPLLHYGQTFFASYSPSGWGFSYDVTAQVSLTKSDKFGKYYTVTLKSVTVQSKGWKEVDGKYYSCNQLGNLCNNHFPGVLSICLKFNYNGARSSCTANYSRAGEQLEVTIPWQDASDITGIVLQNINEDPAFLPLVNSRIKELNKTNTTSSNSSVKTTGNTNPLSSISTNSSTSNDNPLPNNTTTTTSNIDPNTGLMTNPLPYTAPASNNKFVQDVQVTTQAISAAIDLFTPSPEEQERRRVQQEKNAQINQLSGDLNTNSVAEFRDFLNRNPKLFEAAKIGDSKARQIILDKRMNIRNTYYFKLKKTLTDEKDLYQRCEKNGNDVDNVLGKDVIKKWEEEVYIDKALSDSIVEVKDALKLASGRTKYGYINNLYANEAETGIYYTILALKNAISLGEMNFGKTDFSIFVFLELEDKKDRDKFENDLKKAGIETNDPKILDYFLFVLEANISKNVPATELSKSILTIVCNSLADTFYFSKKSCESDNSSKYAVRYYSNCDGYGDKAKEYKNLIKSFK